MGAVHQFVPALLPGDATGHHTLEVRDVVRGMGLESEIYVESKELDPGDHAHHFTSYPRQRGAGDVLLYHMAAASELADFLYSQPERLVVDYHNITPARFFRPWDMKTASDQVWSRAQATRLADRATLGIGDSQFNEAELLEMGYGQTTVVPILVDLDSFDDEVDARRAARLERAKAAGGADLVFVGRLAPNKAQHDLVKAFYAYRRLYDPRARLHLVGRTSAPRYLDAVRALVAELNLADAVEFAESVSHGELTAYYRAADVLVCCSEHEGFCVPLLEAMHHGVPIVAYAAAAVPETVGDAGILIDSKGPLVVAAAVNRVMTDESLRRRLAEAGRRRLAYFAPERSRTRLVEALQPLVGEGG
jgi:glycosyltransferase involved in cell wall biosynthesis